MASEADCIMNTELNTLNSEDCTQNAIPESEKAVRIEASFWDLYSIWVASPICQKASSNSYSYAGHSHIIKSQFLNSYSTRGLS